MTENQGAVARTAEPRVQVSMDKTGLRFGNLDELLRFATGLIQARMVPDGMQAGGVVAIVQAGAEVGLPPMQSLAHLTFVKGRLGIDGMAALALVRRSGVCREDGQPSFRLEGEPYTPGWTAVCRAHRKDRAEATETSFSLEDAIRMGLVRLDAKKQPQGRGRQGSWSDSVPWATATADMLQWRAWARMHKREFADVVLGLGVTEELRDIAATEPERDVTTQVRVRAQEPATEPDSAPDPLLDGEDGEGPEPKASSESEEPHEAEPMPCSKSKACALADGHPGECYPPAESGE